MDLHVRVNLQLVQRKKTQTAVIKKEINKSNPFFSFFFCARTRQCLCGKQVIGSISFPNTRKATSQQFIRRTH